MNIRPVCEFVPEFEDDQDQEEPSNKKKRYRYRWPDEIREDVLARLLVLNRERYQEEVLAGLHVKGVGRKRAADEESEEQGDLDL